MRLKFYRVSEWYTDELRKISPSGVTDNNKDHINTYVGILIIINNVKYIAPLTHVTLNNKWHQQPIIITNSKNIITNKLGTILLHNMIPVYDCPINPIYYEVDLTSYKALNPQKYNLYSEQLKWMNTTNNKNTIINKAKHTYDVHLDSSHRDNSFLNNTLNCSFTRLEKRMNQLASQKK